MEDNPSPTTETRSEKMEITRGDIGGRPHVLDRTPILQPGERKTPVQLKRTVVMGQKPKCRAPAVLADLDHLGAHGRVGRPLPDLAFLETHRLLLSGGATIGEVPAGSEIVSSAG